MAQQSVAILHPGEMGSMIGARLRDKGLRVVWASRGRGEATRRRADKAGLEDRKTLAEALSAGDVALAVCPPHGALDLAREVAAQKFRGVYVDANAVSPNTSRSIGKIIESGGASYVDGGIVGPPPVPGGSTRLYLSGAGARDAAALLASGPLEAIPLDGPVGAASAFKVCFAAWNKNAVMLLACIRALARREGVEEALLADWRRSDPAVFKRLDAVAGQSRKAWRWIGEMEESAATFEGAGLPGGYARASLEVCRRLAPFKDADPPPALADILRAVIS